MDAQRFDPVAKQPKPLRVLIPEKLTMGEHNEEWPVSFLPSPSPSLIIARRETAYDEQRFDPSKVVEAGERNVLGEVYFSPTLEEPYPESKMETTNEVDYGEIRTAYYVPGASEDDEDRLVCRTIFRPIGARSLRSLVSLTTCSKSSVSDLSFSRPQHITSSSSGSGSGTLSPPEWDSDDDSLPTSHVPSAPPASHMPSRRPSTVFSLSSPVATTELTETLRKLAATVGGGCTSMSAMERHFEEEVDYYEKTWAPGNECTGVYTGMGIEVHIERTVETSVPVVKPCGDASDGFVFPSGGYVRQDGIGIYSSVAVRSRKNTLRAQEEERVEEGWTL